jgi:hypothetical protein
MENFDFTSQPDIPRDRIYVSWNEQWDIERYVGDYLVTRKLRSDAEARARVRKSIEEFNGAGALRKADMDYYLDANVRKELELPAGWAARKGRAA